MSWLDTSASCILHQDQTTAQRQQRDSSSQARAPGQTYVSLLRKYCLSCVNARPLYSYMVAKSRFLCLPALLPAAAGATNAMRCLHGMRILGTCSRCFSQRCNPVIRPIAFGRPTLPESTLTLMQRTLTMNSSVRKCPCNQGSCRTNAQSVL